MRILAAIAILSVLGTGAQARLHGTDPYRPPPRPLVVSVAPPFDDPYATFIPLGPHQLGSPYHTLCGFTLVTSCSQESSYGP